MFVTGTIVRPAWYADGEERWEIRILRADSRTLPYRAYPTKIVLAVRQCEYQAILRFAPSDRAAWIPAHLNHRKVRLVDVLKPAGFARGRVRLKVVGHRIWVVKQPTTARR